MPRSLTPYLWMLLGSLAFSVMGALAHAAGSSCDWQVLALTRSVFPLAFGVLLARASGERLVFWKPRTLWIRSVAGSVSLVCTFYALTQLPISDVFTLTNIFPIWVALLSWPLLGEIPPNHVWAAVGCGVVGVFLVQHPYFAQGNLDVLIPLLASLSTAVAMLGLHRLQGIGIWAIVVHFSAVSLLFSVASFFLVPGDTGPASPFDGAVLAMLCGIGITATIGQFFLTKAFVAGSPAKVSVVGLSQVAFAMVLDGILWSRAFTPATILGIALVLAPTAWLMLRSDEEKAAADLATMEPCGEKI